MCVLKIIYTHPDIFNTDLNKTYTEIEAIRLIGTANSTSIAHQQEYTDYRMTYMAICNLNDLGFMEEAYELARELLTKTTDVDQYKMAQDLCDLLFQYSFIHQDLNSTHDYIALYNKYGQSISYSQQSLSLLAEVVDNFRSHNIIDTQKVKALSDLLLPRHKDGSPWKTFLHYQCQVLIHSRTELESLLIEAIEYYDNLYPNHSSYSDYFAEILISYYLETGELQSAENYLQKLKEGTLIWFRSHMTYVKWLLSLNDLKSNDFCLIVMNHKMYLDLPQEIKSEWKKLYKDSVRLLLRN